MIFPLLDKILLGITRKVASSLLTPLGERSNYAQGGKPSET